MNKIGINNITACDNGDFVVYSVLYLHPQESSLSEEICSFRQHLFSQNNPFKVVIDLWG